MRTITEFKIDVNKRGEYDANTMYYPHDLVTSGDQSFLSVVASKGAALNNPEFWMMIAKGSPGDPGKDGLSAYQLAVQELGFAGSITDWLKSLKGNKGDTGTFDNASLATVPDFQALQGNVKDLQAESANVGGVNLAHNTNTAYVISGDTGGSKNIGSLSNDEWVALAGETITIGVTIEWTNWQTSSNSSNRIGFEAVPSKNGTTDWGNEFSLWYSPENGSSGKQRLTVTKTLIDGIDGMDEGYAYMQGGCDTAKISELMIERGSVAHSWSPNPTEILTQADYAKIKDPSIWGMKVAVGGNVSGRSITDLYNASATNLPAVNDLVVQPDGNVFSVTGVTEDATSGAADGGGTFNIGPVLFSIKGDKGDPGAPGQMAGFINTVDYTKYTNMNELTSGPVFYLSQKLANQPADVTSSFLIVMNNSDNSVATQIFINPATNDVYIRSLTGGTWTDWRWITQW